MEINFCGPAVPGEDGGISYRVIVDGKTVACKVSMEALQDIDPANRQSNPMAQFESHQGRILQIAENKIRNGDVQDNKVWILTKDL